MGARTFVDVERVTPFVRLAGELVEGVGIGRLRRFHFDHGKIADLVGHHQRDRLGSQNSVALQTAP
jgi:hypothetical protein